MKKQAKLTAFSSDNLDILQDFVDNTSEIIIMISTDGDFLFINNAFIETLGYSRSLLKSMNLFEMLHPLNKAETVKNFNEIKNGAPKIEDLIVLKSSEGRRVYLSGDINCRFVQGEAVSFRCILRDITLRRRAEISQNLYYSIAQSNLNTKNLTDFLAQVHINLQKNIYANNFFVAVFEPEENSIYFPYQVDEHYVQGVNYEKRKLGNGLIEYSMVQNKPLILSTIDLENLIATEKLFIYGPVLPAIQVMVPLKINEKTIGLIGIKSYSDANKFSSRDLELLEFVSGQIAIAMERKKAEENLLLQTSRLNAIFDSSTHYIWTVNQKRQLTSFNKNYYNLIFSILGSPPEIKVSTEKLGWKLIHPEDRPILREKYNLALNGSPQYFEMNWGEIDGGSNWFEFYLNPILSSDTGEIEEVSGIARNITEKKNASINIQKSEEKFRNTIESFIDIYYRTDLAGKVSMISPSVFTHTGYQVSEVINQKVDKFFENAQNSAQDIKSLLKSGSLTNFEVIVKRKNGILRQFMLNIRMIKDSKGIPIEVEGVARDITELKKSAEELKIAKEEAEHSLKIKEQFLANMSHEIRTPMNGIIGMIDVINETPLEKDQKEYVQIIKKSSETLLTILNDILDLSKIEAGKMEVQEKPFDLIETLESLVSLFKQKASEKYNSLTYLLTKNTPRYYYGDQVRILQILSNLTSNAIKFTSNGDITIKVSLLDFKDDKNTLKVEIVDTGIGISIENQNKLFNSFEQLDISSKKSFGGTGLGLVISKELAKKMGGDMGLESEIGKGSIFWFTLCLRVASSEEVINTHKEENEIVLNNYFKNYSPKILLVDDNAINRKVASEILKRANCEVDTAESGMEAIQKFRIKTNFDLILMDIQMPEMDGIETTQLLKKEFGSKLPKVVAMTAYSMQNDKENFLSKGLDDYISKPIRANILIKKVEDLIFNKTSIVEKTNNTIKIVDVTEKYFIDPSIPMFEDKVINSLKEMVGAEMMHSVFEDFEKEADIQIRNTYNAFNNNDNITIQKELHTLKGNSGTIGLMRIHEVTKDIESPAKSNNLKGFEDKYSVLVKEFEAFKDSYKNM